MLLRRGASLVGLVLLTSCATAPEDIKAIPVPASRFAGHDCEQLRAEMVRVGERVFRLTGVQRQERYKDQAAIFAGLVSFWPAIFATAGTDKKAELALLKGEYDALRKAELDKHCAVIAP
jgi:hypothetical protein